MVNRSGEKRLLTIVERGVAALMLQNSIQNEIHHVVKEKRKEIVQSEVREVVGFLERLGPKVEDWGPRTLARELRKAARILNQVNYNQIGAQE